MHIYIMVTNRSMVVTEYNGKWKYNATLGCVLSVNKRTHLVVCTLVGLPMFHPLGRQ